MPAKHPRRGRPKGSGLDDRGQLLAIADLIAKDPGLKPTTAIKSLGVSDPSTIRRLRDKYRNFQNSTEISKPASNTKLAQQPKAPLKSNGHARPIKKVSTTRPELRTPRQPRTPKPMQTASEASLGEPASWLNRWTALGLQTLATSIDVQIAAYRNLMIYPPVAFALKQQSVFNDFALSLCKQQQKPLLMRPQ